MVLAALLWMVLPLLRAAKTADADPSSYRKERRISGAVVAVLVPVLAVAMYAGLSNWDWQATHMEQMQAANMDEAVGKLEAKLAENPKNLEGWMMLGRSYTAMSRYARAADAFQQAYDLSQGQDVEAVVGLGEALALTDEASLTGRAGKLFEAALIMAPTHPKALWYGGIASLREGDLRKGRDRFQLLMAQNPPDEFRNVLAAQIADLNQQLGEGGQGAAEAAPPAAAAEKAPAPAAAGGSHSIQVAVSIAPELQQQLSGAVPLFILARDPGAGGPPLAVQRHRSSDLPLKVELSERDAMIPARTLATVSKVLVVARISRSGAPQQQSGDLYGEAEYEFGKNSGPLSIIIDRTVP